jgi:hypothetical protein
VETALSRGEPGRAKSESRREVISCRPDQNGMWRKLGIGPGEERIFTWGAVALFLLGSSDAFLKVLSETLVVKRTGLEDLPKAFLVSALLLAVTTGVFGRLAARSDRLRLLPRTMLGLALGLVPLWLLLPAAPHLLPAVLVVANKQITSISLLAFWIAMGDLLHARQAKRLFGPLMAGVTLGTILASQATQSFISSAALLPLAAGSLALAGLATLPLRGLRPRLGAVGRRVGLHVAEEGAHGDHSAWMLWRDSSLFRWLFVIALATGVAGPMLYVLYLHAVDLGRPGEEGFLDFIAGVNKWSGVATLLAQVLLVNWLYRRIGIPLSIALSPAVYLTAFVGLGVRLSAAVGSAARVGTKLQDGAVYDPAVRVIYNLFPEEIRPRASALIEGPVKRFGGVLGNALCWGVLAGGVAMAPWIGYLGVPVAAAWLGVSLLLWRQYPRLLLAATASRSGFLAALEDHTLLDPATVRALVPELASPDPERARIALELVTEAPIDRAVPALAEALELAPRETRPRIVAALDRLLEGSVGEALRTGDAVPRLEAVLADAEGMEERERADLVQAVGRLGTGEEGLASLQRALEDPLPAVRLAAHAALARRGQPPDDRPGLDVALAAALESDDAAERRTAREELRALLLCDGEDPGWERRLDALSRTLEDESHRAEAAEALVEVARRHGERAAVVRNRLLALRDDPDPRLRAALLRYCGHAGLLEETGWIVDHLGSARRDRETAAREALKAIGPAATDVLLRELSYGRRSKRDSILQVMRELPMEPETLRALYEHEVDAMERDLLHIFVLRERRAFALLSQRLEERACEKLHTALLFLAAIRHEDHIAELGERLRDPAAQGRHHHAIVLEALEATLSGEEKARLIPFLEEGPIQDKALQLARTRVVPSLEETLQELLKAPDGLTRRITCGVALAAGFEVEDHDGVDTVEKMLHLKALPLFEGLTARQLMNLAGVVKEETLPAGTVVVRQHDCDDRLFLLVEGVAHILRGETLLAEMGPGDFFGEIALFEGTARTADAVARTRLRLLVLDRADLLTLIEEMPSIAVTLLETLSRRVRELTDRLTV